MKTPLLKVVLPIVLVGVGAAAAYGMFLTRAKPETRILETTAPLVRVQTVTLEDLRLSVFSQGTVSPRTESELVPEVAGRVVWVSPSFVSGGYFEKDEPLLRIDTHDYHEAVVQAQAQVARAELRRAQEEAEAEVARREWEDLGAGDPSALTLREPQLAEAEAALAASRAVVERARRDLDRTEIRAPYVGRVRGKQVDVGQYVSRGTPVASVYAVDYAEVRLPLPNDQLAFIDLPLDYRGDPRRQTGPEVTLRATFAGYTFAWQGRITRTEGEIDPKSRMVHVVAEVADPYARGADPNRPPLGAGLYVEAEISGHLVEDVAVIPRSAIRDGDVVLVVDDENRLRMREVEVLRRRDDRAIVRGGLADGERICVSPLVAVTDGMHVRVAASRDAS